MIANVSHVGVWVLDQDEAYDFYVNKLGFHVHTDARMDDYRWLTATPPEQPDLQIMLGLPGPPALDADAAEQIKSLIAPSDGRGHPGHKGLSTHLRGARRPRRGGHTGADGDLLWR